MSISQLPADRTDPLAPEADLAGLAVHDVCDLRVGHVYGVLTEAETGLVRFLDVEIDGSARHVLIPIGHARLEDVLGQRRIRLRAATIEDLEKIPAYNGEGASAQLARDVAGAHGRLFRGAHYYAHPAYNHRGLYAGEHPIVPARPLSERSGGLERLSESTMFRVASGEPDVSGWSVSAAGEKAGRVHDLIFDPEAEQVRYAEVELPDETTRLLPIGYLELERENKTVLAPGLTIADLETLPVFAGVPLTRTQEDVLLGEIDRLLDARNPFLRVDFSGREVIA